MQTTCGPSLEDRRRGSAAEAAGRVECVNAKKLVDQAAGDAHHRSAAVLALSVELEGLHLWVVIAHPRVEGDVTGLGILSLRLGREASARLLHAGEDHDLQPASGWDSLERCEAASRDVLELEVHGGGQVARHADASVEGNDVEEAKHGSGAARTDLAARGAWKAETDSKRARAATAFIMID